MVYEDVAEEWELRVFRRNLPGVRTEWSTEALQRSWCVELANLILGLLGNELALEIYLQISLACAVARWLVCIQCSCFPVKIEPSGGTDMVESFEYVVSPR